MKGLGMHAYHLFQCKKIKHSTPEFKIKHVIKALSFYFTDKSLLKICRPYKYQSVSFLESAF